MAKKYPKRSGKAGNIVGSGRGPKHKIKHGSSSGLHQTVPSMMQAGMMPTTNGKGNC